MQKRQQKKKKRRTANSYSDISFNDKYKLTEELLGTGAHGYESNLFSSHSLEIDFYSFSFRVVKACRDRVTKQEYAVKVWKKNSFFVVFPLTLVFSCPTFSSGGFAEQTTPKIKSIAIDVRSRAKERKKRKEKKRASTNRRKKKRRRQCEEFIRFDLQDFFLSFTSGRTYEGGKKGQ